MSLCAIDPGGWLWYTSFPGQRGLWYGEERVVRQAGCWERRTCLRLACLLILMGCLRSAVAAEDLGTPITGEAHTAFLTAWGTQIRRMHTLHMTFQQAKHLRMLRQPLLTRGELWLKEGTLLYVLTNTAGQQELVVRLDPQTVRVYYPLLATMEVLDLKSTGGQTPTMPAVWQMDPEAMGKDYDIALFETAGRYTLRLVPKETKGLLQEMRLVIQDLQPQELVQVDKNGTRLHMQITTFTMNPALSAAQLELHVPEGTQVTQPLH